MKILFIQTGGTIDKDYPRTQKGYAFEIYEPAVVRILEKLNPTFEYQIISAFRKDSQEIIESDRQLLLEICQNSQENQIIITHGTDTMIETAIFFRKYSKQNHRTHRGNAPRKIFKFRCIHSYWHGNRSRTNFTFWGVYRYAWKYCKSPICKKRCGNRAVCLN